MVLEPDKLGVENHSIHNILVEIHKSVQRIINKETYILIKKNKKTKNKETYILARS